MAWLETTLDLGRCGQRSVLVEYQERKCLGIEIKSVIFNGTEIYGWLDEDAEEILRDECKADADQADACATEAYWEQKRDEERMCA